MPASAASLGLIDLVEELDALVGDVLLHAGDGLLHGIGALELDDAVTLGGLDGERGEGEDHRQRGRANQTYKHGLISYRRPIPG